VETETVAFGSALLGVAGGFIGALMLESMRVRRRRNGIIRALLIEMRHNGFVAVELIHADVALLRFTDEVWQASRLELAEFLKRNLYERIATTYLRVLMLERAEHVYSDGKPPSNATREFAQAYLRDLKEVIRFLALEMPMAILFGPPDGRVDEWLTDLETAAIKGLSRSEAIPDGVPNGSQRG
jgi:hypothetical protein